MTETTPEQRFDIARNHAAVNRRIRTVAGGMFQPGLVGTLTRKQADGMWFARMDEDHDEWCVGSGYDWELI